MIVISPFARGMRNGERHPKNYPWFPEVISRIDEHIIQVGVTGEQQLVSDFRTGLPLTELATIVDLCKTWVSVDSFFQHFCWDQGKPGIVLFAQSDPNIFGHPENVNLLKDRKYLRDRQFWLWEQCEYIEESFVSPDEVIEALRTFDVKIK